MVTGPRRFAIRYAPVMAALLTVLGAGPRLSGIEVDGGAVTIRMGWVFSVRIPLDHVARVSPQGAVWWAIGVHTNLTGRWVVNGSPRGMVRIDVAPPIRGRFMGLPVRVSRVDVSAEDPDALLAALGQRPSPS